VILNSALEEKLAKMHCPKLNHLCWNERMLPVLLFRKRPHEVKHASAQY
jgi:hypothetical protein